MSFVRGKACRKNHNLTTYKSHHPINYMLLQNQIPSHVRDEPCKFTPMTGKGLYFDKGTYISKYCEPSLIFSSYKYMYVQNVKNYGLLIFSMIFELSSHKKAIKHINYLSHCAQCS